MSKAAMVVTRENLTVSPAPVAPSISSIMSRTGFLLPTADPDSNVGLTRSSITDPDRASLG